MKYENNVLFCIKIVNQYSYAGYLQKVGFQ